MATLRERIAERYPDMLPLLGIPEVAKLLEQAVDPNSPMSATSFQSKLRATKWFRGQSASERQWYVTSQSDPGEATQQREQYRSALSHFSQTLGVKLSPAQIAWLSEIGLAQGLEVNSDRMRAEIIRQWGGKDLRRGEIGTNAQEIMRMAKAEFFRPMSSNESYELAKRVALGSDTMESIRTRLMAQAGDRFPHLRQRISEGLTPGQIVEPYRAIVAEELEYGDISEVNMNNPTWKQLLGVKQKDGKMRMLTESETMMLARSQRRWWDTQNGRSADAGLTRKLLESFGVRRV